MSESAPRRFTLHVDFLATDDRGALNQAEAYVEALNLLRLEIDGYTARVSRDGGWTASMPVYCGAPGPDPTDVCTERAAHPPPHSGPGITGRWNDGDLPRAPDTIEQIITRFTYFNGAPSQRGTEDDPGPAPAPGPGSGQEADAAHPPGPDPGPDDGDDEPTRTG